MAYNIPMKTNASGKSLRSAIIVAMAATVLSGTSRADELKLPAMLGDNAVIQRDIPVPVWGWGNEGSRVAVSLNGKTVYATVKEDGRWKLMIGPFPAGKLGDLVVTCKKDSVTSKNLAAGEVWFCAGQSNMALSVASSTGWDDEMKACIDPHLRLMRVPETASKNPMDDANTVWRQADPVSVEKFSAVGYYFGRNLRKELGVPVGIIVSAWNGTKGEAWTPLKELKEQKDFKPIFDRWKKMVARDPRIAFEETNFKIEVASISLVPADSTRIVPLKITSSSTLSEWSDPTTTDNSWASFKVSENKLAFTGRLGVSGWAAVTHPLGTYEKPEDYSRYNAIRLRVRGQGYMRLEVRATDVWDWAFHLSKPFKLSSKWEEVTLKFTDFSQPDWGWAKPLNAGLVFGIGLTADTGMPIPEVPAGLFNGMVAPVMPHHIRGVLWYQGESNADRAEQYGKLLPALIKGWRREWREGDFPFYVVQLANFGAPMQGVEENDWSELREAQASVLALPNTGLATAIDLGEADNIHPKNKPELAYRLSLVALANVYGKSVEYSGPIYASSRAESGKIIITFTHADGLKPREGAVLKGFGIAGADRVFHEAQAVVEGNTVVVGRMGVLMPVSVRYSWARNPAGNLVNASGLPALPFRTDNWKLTTSGKR